MFVYQHLRIQTDPNCLLFPKIRVNDRFTLLAEIFPLNLDIGTGAPADLLAVRPGSELKCILLSLCIMNRSVILI